MLEFQKIDAHLAFQGSEGPLGATTPNSGHCAGAAGRQSACPAATRTGGMP
jgi:hypothetical protein